MLGKVDLHVHSNFSEDADYSVEELFKLALDNNVSVISITDHDSLESIAEAKRIINQFDLIYVPGIEITTVFDDGTQQHILGYFIEENNELKDILNQIYNYRKQVAIQRINKLKTIGFHLDEKNVWKKSGNRAPTATAIMSEIFDNPENKDDDRLNEYFYGKKSKNRLMYFYKGYLSEGKPAYVQFKSIETKKACEIIKKSKGIPILAHPIFVKGEDNLKKMLDYGIYGVEAISSYHSKDDIDYYIEFAKKNNLIYTAGSDFHGPTTKPLVKLGQGIGNSIEIYESLINLYEKLYK